MNGNKRRQAHLRACVCGRISTHPCRAGQRNPVNTGSSLHATIRPVDDTTAVAPRGSRPLASNDWTHCRPGGTCGLRLAGREIAAGVKALTCSFAAMRAPSLLRLSSDNRHLAASDVAPVVLVHGYASSPSIWLPLARSLALAGTGDIWAFAY